MRNPPLLFEIDIPAQEQVPLIVLVIEHALQSNEFARPFDRFVSEGTERIEEYSSGLLIGLGGFQQERGEVRDSARQQIAGFALKLVKSVA